MYVTPVRPQVPPHVDVRKVKRSRRRIRPRTYYRFWSRYSYQERRFHAEHLLRGWRYPAMDRTRSAERRGLHQGCGHFLFCDANDRGTSPPRAYTILPLAYDRPRLSQVFTDSVLFGGSGIMVVVDIMQGRRPPRPEHPAVTSQLWKLIQRCWNQAPHLRPQAEEVLKWLLESFVSRRFSRLLIY